MSRLFLMGEDTLFYLNTGTNAVPVWAEIEWASEVNVDRTKGEATLKPKSIAYELTRGTKMQLSISFKYAMTLATDPIFDGLLDSFDNKTPKQFAWADRDIADANVFGVKAWCEVMKFPLPGKAEEGVEIDTEAKLTDYVEGGGLILPEYL